MDQHSTLTVDTVADRHLWLPSQVLVIPFTKLSQISCCKVGSATKLYQIIVIFVAHSISQDVPDVDAALRVLHVGYYRDT
jgi:hypothetical protein